MIKKRRQYDKNKNEEGTKKMNEQNKDNKEMKREPLTEFDYRMNADAELGEAYARYTLMLMAGTAITVIYRLMKFAKRNR